MSDFIACTGCGATIHQTAPSCSKCGAPQAVATAGAARTVTAETRLSYATVPWFRRRWFLVLCILSLTPIASLIAMTGEVFYASKGTVKPFAKNARNSMIFACVPWAIYVFSRGASEVVALVALIALALLLAFKK